MWENFKSKINKYLQDDTIFLALLLIMVALTAFGLGRMAEQASQVKYIEANAISIKDSPVEVDEYVVASKKGTKYHLPWCAGAQQMNEENKIIFESKADAEVAGYEPAQNCPGL